MSFLTDKISKYHLLPGRLRIVVPEMLRNKVMVSYLETQLKLVEGINNVSTNYLTGKALIYFDPSKISFGDLYKMIQAVRTQYLFSCDKCAATYAEEVSVSDLTAPNCVKEGMARTACVLLTGGVLAALIIKRFFIGRSALASSDNLFKLATVTTIVAGYPMLRRGITYYAKRKRINSDLLIFATTILLLSMRESITGLSVLWLVYLSDMFHFAMQARSRRVIRNILQTKQIYGTVGESEGRATEVVVKAGDNIVFDSMVLAGKALVVSSIMNGEGSPVHKCVGDVVYAGMKVESGQLTLSKPTIEQNIKVMEGLVKQAKMLKSPTMPKNDFYAQRLMPVTIAIAGAVYLGTRDISRALSILIAGCPIAISIAKNTALGTAVAEAAREGIFVKDADCVEMAGQTSVVLFDKTGTLTVAKPQVTEVVSLTEEFSEDDLIRLSVNAGMPRSYFADTIQLSSTQQAKGRRGKKETVLLGDKSLMLAHQIDINDGEARVKRIQHLGGVALYIAKDKKLIGLIGVKDILRPESNEAINMLRGAGIENIGMITGDNQYTAAAVAGELGIQKYWSGMKPEDKVKLVNSMRQEGHQVMVIGDGINDSPAFAAADIAVALDDNITALPINTANVVVAGSDVRKVASFVEISNKTHEIIKQNLSFAVGLNAAGIALAALQIISPIAASLLLNIGTIGVIANSARLLHKKNSRVINQHAFNLQAFSNRHLCSYELSQQNLQQAERKWHSIPLGQVCDEFQTCANGGLREHEITRRRSQYGWNALAEAKKRSIGELFINQLKDFMTQVLLGAAALSFALGKVKDVVLTVAIITANTLLGVAQERRAEESVAVLKKMASPMAKVVRDSQMRRLPSRELVPGDIILLEAGDCVPADARLLTTCQFEVEEAPLTGETIPVKKKSDYIGTGNDELGDRKNMVYMGTNVTRGRAMAVVTAIGMNTEMGKIAGEIIEQKEEKTPLQYRLEELGKYLVYGCIGVSGIIFVTGLLRGEGILQMLQTAASLAVAAIPEGLSAIVIIALAMGVQRMSRQNIIIRKLSSIETLGCASVICSDKTGTLTQNQMTVRMVYTCEKKYQVTGDGYMPEGQFLYDGEEIDPHSHEDLSKTLLGAALCNNAKLVKEMPKNATVVPIDKNKRWKIEGDPTEGALVVAATKAGYWSNELEKVFVRVMEIPFESERRMMSIICQKKDEPLLLFCKGAPDSVLARCTHYLLQGKSIPLTEEVRKQILDVNDDMAEQALRVLAVAYSPLTVYNEYTEENNYEQNLIFCGLMGMIDPPRPEVPLAIEKCQKAGVKVVMITGDHPKTACAIGRELGLLSQDSKIMLGKDIDAMNDEQLALVVGNIRVYARTSPHHKLRIIKALKQNKYVVAMTGDGVNDAPAVKAADIGIAMGMTGTDVTKGAASMTLADDNFATIVRAMEEGRAIYANIRKAIRYLVATNIGEVVLMLLSALAGLPLPLLPIQLLWINLVGDGLPAIALVNDPPAKNIMEQPPRTADESVFSGGLGFKIITRGIIIGVVSLAVYYWKLITSGNIIAARALVLAQLAISQFIHIFDCRLEKETGKVKLWSNLPLIGAVALSMAMVVGVIQIPFLQTIFGVTAITAFDWIIAILTALISAGLDISLQTLVAKIKNLKVAGNRSNVMNVDLMQAAF